MTLDEEILNELSDITGVNIVEWKFYDGDDIIVYSKINYDDFESHKGLSTCYIALLSKQYYQKLATIRNLKIDKILNDNRDN
jgi:hypothetical protein